MGTESVNPDMILLARDSRAWSQSKLSEESGISQAHISKYEAGILQASKEHLTKLSKALCYPEEFFYQAGERFATDLLYRKAASNSVKVLHKIEARMNITRQHVRKLYEHVGVEWSHSLPDFSDMLGYMSVEDIANECRRHLQLPHGPIRNLTTLIERAASIVVPLDYGSAKVDAVNIVEPNLYRVFFINLRSLGDRLRFSLSHELGHIALGHKSTSLRQKEQEQEANNFSGAFLMPKRDILPDLRSLTLDRLTILKIKWGVSMQAIILRAERIGKLTRAQSQYLFMSISKRGWRKREPKEFDIPLEKPQLFRNILNYFEEKLNYSSHDLCKLLLLSNEKELNELYFPERHHRIFSFSDTLNQRHRIAPPPLNN